MTEFTDQELKLIADVASSAGTPEGDSIFKKANSQLKERERARARRRDSLLDDIGWLTGTGRFAQ